MRNSDFRMVKIVGSMVLVIVAAHLISKHMDNHH